VTHVVTSHAERVMGRHGGKTVFFGRFVAVLRYTVAWVAGLARMPWWRFFFWNAAGGIAWATTVGLVSYYLGKKAAAVVAAAIIAWLGLRLLGKRIEREL